MTKRVTLGKSSSPRDWAPPSEWLRIETVDAHAAGEPLRVIVSGFPEVKGKTILERRRVAKETLDHLRTALLWEPRGHADMYGCLLTPPVTPGADFGVLFLHNAGYSTMCGHGIIAVTTVVLETGLVPARKEEVRIDTPAGLVTARARVADGRVESVAFRNVPSFVLALDDEIDVAGVGRVRFDLAFGGAFYAYVQAKDVGLSLTPSDFRDLIDRGMAIKRAIMASRPIRHPFEEDLGFLYGTIFVGPAVAVDAHGRHVCVFAEGEVDRSPTGTGVSGRLAIAFARGEIKETEPLVVESILGTRFTGRVVETTRFGPYAAVIPEVEGSAYITGRSEFLIDPNDPLRHGFILR
jgi:trans-L-3-hydroxyproline dehydratase